MSKARSGLRHLPRLTTFRLAAVVLSALLVVAVAPAPAHAVDIAFEKVSSDPFGGICLAPPAPPCARHKTQVEPDTYAYNGIVVSAFQSGRYDKSGAVGIGFATSNGGLNWSSGHLPNLTKGHGGVYDRVSDPSVAYSRKHNVWLISTLALLQDGVNNFDGAALLTSRSTDSGLTWSAPVVSLTRTPDPDGTGVDKNWIVCDNTLSSSFFGTCYVQYHDGDESNRIKMIRSLDGGTSWDDPVRPEGDNFGWGGQPVVTNNGAVVVPYTKISGGIYAFRSTDGGSTWHGDFLVSEVETDEDASTKLRGVDQNFVSAEVDGAGWVYVVWSDCSRRRTCEAGNDIVMSKSRNGVAWATPTRVTFSSGDHVIPAVAADRSVGGRLAVVYLRSTNPDCTSLSCTFSFGYVTSTNGGASWSADTTISPQMPLEWMPSTSKGRMLGDYFSASIMGGRVFTVIPIALKPKPNTLPNDAFRQSMYVPYTPGTVPSQGLPITGGPLH